MKSLPRLLSIAVVIGSAAFCLNAQAQTKGRALVRHAPTLNGSIDGSVQQMLSEAVTLNGGAAVTGDLLVPGTPTVRLNGNPAYGGTLDGTGSNSPSNYQITLNGNASLRNVIRRTDAVALPVVKAPPLPAGTRSVNINSASQSPGDFTTLRNLTLNGNVGQFAIPAGIYGDFTANGSSGFTLGVAGATQPSVYNLQHLTLNGNARLAVVGPVILNLNYGFTANGNLGSTSNPAWLTLNIFGTDGFVLNGGSYLYGSVNAPQGTVTVNGNSQLVGGVTCDRLTVNGNGLLRLSAPNLAPTVSLIAPAAGAIFTAPATIAFQAAATDSDGTVAKVEFFNGATKLGEVTAAPYQFSWASVAAGTYALTAKATDNTGATTTSSAVTIIVNAPPSVALTAPTNNTIVAAPATITLQATASDADGTVAKVEFFNGATRLGSSTAAPYTFVWSNVAYGVYSLTAVATDNRGATQNSTPVTLVVNSLPSVALTSPAANALFTAPASISLAATATDLDGSIAKVEFFNGATKLGEATAAPYQYQWLGVGAGAYSLTSAATDNRGARTVSSPVAIQVQAPNVPPVIALTAPANGSVYNAPGSFTLVAAVSDADGSVAKVEFFQGATKLGETTVAPYQWSISGLAAGSYAYTAKATDNRNGVSTSSAVTVIVNAPPSVALTAPANNTVFAAPATITLQATATDADGTIAKVEFFNGTTKLGETTTAPYQWQWTGVAAGTYTVTAKATDDRGAVTTSASVGFVVNAPPAVTLTAPVNNAVFTAPAALTFTATASDADGTIAKVEFFSGATKLGEGTPVPGQSGTFTLPFTFTTSGTYSFTAKATDNRGAVSVSEAASVLVNAPPSVALTAPADGTVINAPADVTLQATASDSDGTVAKVEFFNGTAKIGEATAAPYQFQWTGVLSGTYTITATVTDNLGATATSAPITIVANALPNVSLTAPVNNATFTASATILLAATATDSDGSIAKVEFFNGATKIGETTTAPYQITWPNVAAGAYTLKAKATDNVGGSTISDPIAIQVTQPIIPPTVALTAPANGVVYTAPASLVLSAAASASNASIVKVEFFQGSTKLGEAFTAPYQLPLSGLSAGSFTFTARATDSNGVVSTSDAVTVLVNAPPTVSLTAPVAGSIFAAPANLTLQAIASDSDGSIAKIEFFNGTTKLGETTSQPYQFQWVGVAAGTFTVTVRATDNLGASTTSAPVTIVVNALPTVALTAPANNALFTAPAAFTLAASASDSDGSVAKVEFFQGATKLGEIATAPYQWPVSNLPAGNYTYTAKATDDRGGSNISSAVSVPVNAPPSVALTAPLDGTVITAPVTIVLQATASDADGTVAKVEFFNGPTKIGEATTAPYQFTWTAVPAGTYTVTAKATDNLGATATSASVTLIANTLPTVSFTAPANNAVLLPNTAITLSATATDTDGTVAKVEFFDGATKLGDGMPVSGQPATFTLPFTFTTSGSHTLTARATDDAGAATTSTLVMITVNAPPVANPQTVTATQDTALAITLTGSDPEGSPLTYTIVTQPVHGTLTPSVPGSLTPSYTYTPATGYKGGDSFAFKVNDGIADSSPATVTITIVMPNAPPVVDAGPDQQLKFVPHVGPRPRGRIIVNNDEWALTDQGFASSPNAGRFTRNLADFLTGGKPGAKFLAYTNIIPGSVDFIYTGQQLAAAMAAAGHSWTTSSTVPMTLTNLLQYDAVFLGANNVDNQVLIDYVEAGGSVYLSAGTHWSGGDADVEAALWNKFLEHFGLHYGYPYNGVTGTIPVASDHPLFHGVSSLYFANGNSVFRTASLYSASEIVLTYDDQGLFGVFGESDNQVFLYGSVTDDGNPNGFLSWQWSQVSGPADSTIEAPTSLTTRVRFPQSGIYVLRLTATDGAATTSKDVTITLNASPVVDAGANIAVRNPSQPVTLTGTVLDDGILNPTSTQWTLVSGPGTAAITSPNSLSTQVTFGGNGIYTFKLAANDGLATGSAYTEVRAGILYDSPVPTQIAAWWPGNGAPIEVVRGGHDVQLIGGAGFTSGKVASAFTFDGVSGYGLVKAHPDLDIGNSAAGFTIEFWINVTDSARNEGILEWQNGVAIRKSSYYSERSLYMTLPGNVDCFLSSTYFVPTGWLHVGLTYDRATGMFRTYRNGVLLDARSIGTNVNFGTNGDFMLAHGFYGLLKGQLDELALYTRPLSGNEILAIYNANTIGKSPPNGVAPVVNAGSDIVVANASGTAVLQGTATEDGSPQPLVIAWSQLAGPGTATFANPASAATTATFSAPGVYVLQLAADDGLNRARPDTVVVRAGVRYSMDDPTGLAAWWPANGKPAEVVHGGHDVQFSNGAGYASGQVGLGFTYDGISQYGFVPAHSDLNIGASAQGLSIEFWVKPDTTNNRNVILWSNGTNSEGVGVTIGSNITCSLRDTSGTDHSLGGGTIQTGVWQHIIVTYDKPSGQARIYRNGVLAVLQYFGSFTPQTTYDLYFGALVRGAQYFKGSLDEISLYTRALSPAEAQSLYQAGSFGKSPIDSNAAPAVNAGPDLIVRSVADSISLQGTATDDGGPFPLTVAWSKVDGPGSVIFSDATQVTPTATFSMPGIYLLKLTADDGLNVTSDIVEVRVAAFGTSATPSQIAAWWPGNGTAAEMVHGHTVQFVDAVGYAPSQVSMGFTFDGVSAYGFVPAHPDLNLGASAQGLSMEFWVKPDTTNNRNVILWSNGTNSEGVGVTVGSNIICSLRDTSGTDHSFEGGTIQVGVWQHVVVTYDKPSGQAQIFRNGVLAVQQNLGTFTPQTTYDLCLGAFPRNAQYFKGGLDEITLYTRALSFAEARSLYQAGSFGKSPLDNSTAPVVSAGPDLAMPTAPGTATLNGVAADDGRPFPLTVAWSQLDGPSTVTFDNVNQVATTATFASTGLYTLKLQADDGLFRRADFVSVRVGLPPPSAAPDGLVAWWTGNNTTDESVRGYYNAELQNGAGFAPARVGSGFHFDGVDDRVRVAANPDSDLGAYTQGFTIELWVKPDTITYGPLLNWQNGSTDGLELWTNNNSNRVTAYLIGYNGVVLDAPGTIEAGVWQHIALTYDRAASVVKIYKNGVSVASGDLSTNYRAATNMDLYIGGNPQYPSNNFAGTLDEISLYNRPLGAAEIASIYNAGAAGKFVPPTNLAPMVNAGPDQTAYVSLPLTLTGTALDDGLPNPPAALTYAWSLVSSPVGSNPPTTTGPVIDGSTFAFTFTFTSPGTYTLRLTASDSLLTGSDDVSVTVTTPASQPPVIAIYEPGAGATLPASTYFEIAAHATDPDGTIAKVEFFQGATKLGQQTVPAAGDPTTYFWPMTGGLPVGSYTFTAKATDNTGVVTTSAPVTFTVITDPGTPPVAQIATPAEDTRISVPTAITGVVASPFLASWALDYRLKAAEGDTPAAWTTFATGTAPIGTPASGTNPSVPQSLGVFDPTLLLNGIYELRLSVTDTVGRISVDGPITLVVEGNMKIGAFTLAFEDLKVPLAGIPITVTRTYDSRDTRVGDFGPGWRLALSNIRVQKNRDLGLAWWQTPQQGSGIQFYYVESLRDRLVTVVMPDGETHRFRAGAYVKVRPGDPDNASFAVVVRQGLYKFYPVGDTTSTLEPLDASNQLYDHFWIDGTGDRDLYAGDYGDFDYIPYNPTRFRLTTKDGTVFLLDERLGLLELHDLNGNTLVLDRNGQNIVTGVTSTQNAPGGPLASSVTIHRDGTGRVDYITDPAGQHLDYLYEAQGRLASFTNRELNVTQFRYENANFPYYLTKILDPRGVAALRSEYDTGGRLVKQIDATGQETVFNQGVDATGRFEKVKDRLGNSTSFYYDDRGNVTLKIDPLGAQTSYSYYPDSDWVKFETDHYGNVKSKAYDAHGNVTVETVGAGTAEDPAAPTTGYTTRTAYNASSAPTSITDPDGRVQTFTYDPATNNLLTHTVGAGSPQSSTSTYTYNSDGTLATVTDALGNVTSTTYDYAFSDDAYPGATTKTTVTVTDAAATVLRTSRTLSDAQSNQLAQIVTRTLPDGTTEDVVTRYLYDKENRLVATIAPDGRVTETRYTAFGKQEKSVLWKSVADYATADDTKARITTYGYDDCGNQTSVTYADSTSETTHFDAENHKDWSQDRLGRRTTYQYDTTGRLRFTIQPDATPADLTDNPRTETVYDLVGRVTDTYDELRCHTKYVYYPDGTPNAGRRKQSIQVLTAGNLVTSYQYDASGNVRYVTDPRGNAVETQYDAQGRPTKVIYPATDENLSTQTETQYDALGRRAAIIDQEGKITRYRYDGLGRLTEVRQYLDAATATADSALGLLPTVSGVVSTRYTYDEFGKQLTQTDALGRTTTFWTDALGRRTKRILPKDTAESSALAENLQYDAWGNLWKHTDFSGKITTFGYDTLGRLKSKTADATHPSFIYSHAIARVEFDYDANGARTAARTYNASNTQLYTESTPRDERGRIDYKDAHGVRLDYDYYANGLLKDTVSSNSDGVNLGYRYDELNRLAYVDDGSGIASGTTVRTTDYTYNPNGSLETLTQPNAVVHTYGYDSLNRLRTLNVAQTGGLGVTLHAYEYKLKPSGHRWKVIEGTKTTKYEYDDIYRLTSETVAGGVDPGETGLATYDLDKVGNRKSRTSSVPSVPSSSNTFNARDWLSGDSYDANGNTVQGGTGVSPVGSATDTYDFENRLILRQKSDGTKVNIAYDADGIRIQKTLFDTAGSLASTTSYLVDTNNLTGYAQVVEERTTAAAGTTTKVYTYGCSLISCSTAQPETQNPEPVTVTTRYYACDGHGSVRELTDTTGAITDRYDYDAFGVLVFRSGTSANAYLYCGEQWDADLGLYYNRARYFNPDSGRFWSMDSYEGSGSNPMSLHKYLYAHDNPVRISDPSGHFMSIAELGNTVADVGILATKIAVPRISVAATLFVNTIILSAIYESSQNAPNPRKLQLIEEDLKAEGKTTTELMNRARKKNPPIFLDPIPIWKEVAEHDGFVQTLYPQWEVLHVGPRLGAAEFADINRLESMDASGLSPRSDLDRHEYPFASTLEGGKQALSTYADPGRNRSQGSTLSAFYSVNQLKVGDPFIVLVLP